MIYSDVYKLAKSENRLEFILSKLDDYKLQQTKDCTNIFIEGSSSKLIIAHYDVVNEYNYNDNSASVINAIIYKQNNPEVNVLLTDREESGFVGALNFCNLGLPFSEVINLELTGIGRNLFYSKGQSKIKNGVRVKTPASDGCVFFNQGYRVSTIFLCPDDNIGYHLSKCHTDKDNINNICLEDMRYFVEFILPSVDFL